MAAKLHLFDNINGVETWLNNNCRKCNRANCYTHKQLKKDPFNNLTLHHAEFIGFKNGKLDDICSKKNKVNEGLFTNELIDNFNNTF